MLGSAYGRLGLSFKAASLMPAYVALCIAAAYLVAAIPALIGCSARAVF
jgi:hypothetical protein